MHNFCSHIPCNAILSCNIWENFGFCSLYQRIFFAVLKSRGGKFGSLKHNLTISDSRLSIHKYTRTKHQFDIPAFFQMYITVAVFTFFSVPHTYSAVCCYHFLRCTHVVVKPQSYIFCTVNIIIPPSLLQLIHCIGNPLLNAIFL